MPGIYSAKDAESKANPAPLEFTTRGIRVSARGFREASKIRRAITRLQDHHLEFVESVHEGDFLMGQYKIKLQGKWYMPGNGPMQDEIGDIFHEELT
jgi:hypothetical protein